MRLLDKLFGNDPIVEHAAKGAYNGIDMAVFTQEEKAGHFVRLLAAYEPFKLAQRFLALIVGIPFVVVWIAAVILFTVGAITGSAVIVDASKELAAMNNDTLGIPFGIILVFYFGGGAIESYGRSQRNA